MQLTLTGRKIELTEPLRSFADTKLKKIRRFVDRTIDVRLVLSVEKQRHTAEVTITGDGLILHTKETTNDMYASIDRLIDKLEKLLKKHKERLIDRQHIRKEQMPALMEAEQEAKDVRKDDSSLFVRIKNEESDPISEDAAADRLSKSGNQFLMFRNAGTDEINVIYKKFDGKLGLIEP